MNHRGRAAGFESEQRGAEVALRQRALLGQASLVDQEIALTVIVQPLPARHTVKHASLPSMAWIPASRPE